MVSTEYGLLADAASYPDDFSSVTYRLRGNAKWHDGKPVTADDVVFSFETFKNNSPFAAAYYQHVVKAEKIGEREITFTIRRSRQSRAAADRRPAYGAAQALVGGQGPQRATNAIRPPRRSSRRSAAASNRYQGLRGGPARVVYERVKDYWARTCR